MSSLKEIKDHIGSVRSTLKITSAMKLVASSKLRKAQKAIEGLRPYESALNEILTEMLLSGASASATFDAPSDENTEQKEPASASKKIAVVAISSNSSLCGGFNSNVVRKTLEALRAFKEEGFEIEVHSIGRKMADAMRKAGYASPADYNDLVGHSSYAKSCALASSLAERFRAGELARIVLVYNHFVTSSKQLVVVEPYLPFVSEAASASEGKSSVPSDYIVEPSAEEVVRSLMPQVLMLKFHSAVLDSEAAEHAARTVAMQTATDNATELLSDLTLEYNKGRQQKITAEILDLLGGSAR